MSNTDTDNNQKLVMVATKITANDDFPSLKNGEIDITAFNGNIHMLKLEEILTKFICKKGNAIYYNYGSPVSLIYKSPTKPCAIEAHSLMFDNIEDIILYLKDHKNTLVYEINYFTFKQKYSLRAFRVGLNSDWTPKLWQYYYTQIRRYINKITKGERK